MALALSPLTWIIEKLGQWQVDNSTYVSFVIGAIAVDHILGSIYHAFFARDWSIKENVKGLLIKLLIVISIGYLFEGLDGLMVSSILKEYTIMVLRLMVFLYPATSAFHNSYAMTGQKFPPMAFMEKLKRFSENATINSSENAK